MNRLFYIILTVVILAGLVFVNQMNTHLVHARKEIGITQADPVINAPPMVVFTTVALGGFRGIIADMLWLRSAKLQQEGKFFELVQLADWITKLEPRFSEVWAYHAWNLSYNISVLFTDFNNRWRWVRNGLSLLRDEGLLYNPDDPKLLIELGWLFQHKIGSSIDDAHLVYKQSWAKEMEELLGSGRPDYANLSKETTDKMRKEYKLDSTRMQQIEETYGPLDWRMPQAHSIYWATLSRDHSRGDEILFAERMLYQSMADAFRQGTIRNGPDGQFIPSPIFDLLPYVIQSYEHAMAVFAGIPGAEESYLNFLTEAAIIMYVNNRNEEADRLLIDLKSRKKELPKNLSVEDFVVATYSRQHLQNDDPVQAAMIHALTESQHYQKMGDEIRARGFERLAEAIKKRMNR